MSTTNISLYLVPVAWFIALAPRGYTLVAYKLHSKSKQGVEMRNPRALTAQAQGDSTLSPLIRDRIIRAESAQLNGAENLGFFAAAVVAGNAANLDTTLLNGLTLAYIGSRVLYNVIFVANSSEKFGFVRTLVFLSGIAFSSSLFVLAGKKIAL